MHAKEMQIGETGAGQTQIYLLDRRRYDVMELRQGHNIQRDQISHAWATLFTLTLDLRRVRGGN